MSQEDKSTHQIISVDQLRQLDDNQLFAVAMLATEAISENILRDSKSLTIDHLATSLSISTVLIERIRNEKLSKDPHALDKAFEIVREFRKEKFWDILCKRNFK